MSSFLGDLAQKMGALLLASGFPLVTQGVVFGHEGFDRETETGPYVQILQDPAGDAYEAGTAQQGPSATVIKYCGVLVHFQASSSKPGATEDDHVAALELLTDAFVFNLVALSHHAKVRLRNLKSATVEVDMQASQPTAKMTMQCQIGRGVNRPAPQTASSAILPKMVIRAREPSSTEPSATALASGTHAAIDSLSGDGATLTGLGGVDAAWVGLDLVVTGAASDPNNGTFRIRSVVDATSVIAINGAAVAPDVNNGSIAWRIERSETAVPGET